MSNIAKKATKKIVSAVANPRQAKKILLDAKQKKQIDQSRKRQYASWFTKNYPTVEELEKQKKQAKNFKHRPLISIVLPIYNTNEKYLKACINSVINQTYDNWELCVSDDASTTAIIEVVKEFSSKHKNIKWTRLSKNQHIAVSSNEAIKISDGEFVALLDHDDILMPNALFEMVKMLNENPRADIIYSDEDKIENNNQHIEPFFKPDWSPDYLRSCNYITHFTMLRKTIIDKIGGFRNGTEGAQDWDLFLRATSETNEIYHVPKILYSWRKSETSTAQSAQSKPYAYINQLRVLRDWVQNSDNAASVLASIYQGFWRVKYHIKNMPKVSIIIPTKEKHDLIKTCLESIIEGTTYPNFEIVIVDTGSVSRNVRDLYNSKLVKTNDVQVLSWNKPFNFSAVCNYGAKKAKGEYLLFLNNDTKVITPEWIEGLLEHAQRKEVGMVGCKLLFPNERIQHAGVVLSYDEIAFHPFYNNSPSLDIFTNVYVSNVRNCSAVTAACTMVSRAKFNSVGGFEEKLVVTYNDVDLCLKLLDKGYNNVYTPYTELYHFESMSVGKIAQKNRDKKELTDATKLMQRKWGKYLREDRYYNPNFIDKGPGYEL